MVPSAVWHRVVFPGLQGNVEMGSRTASLAQAAQHIESVVVQSQAGPRVGNPKEPVFFHADAALFVQQS